MTNKKSIQCLRKQIKCYSTEKLFFFNKKNQLKAHWDTDFFIYLLQQA